MHMGREKTKLHSYSLRTFIYLKKVELSANGHLWISNN